MLWLTLRACRPAATLATKDSDGWQSAVCGGGHEMTAGVHCAHFELRKLDGGSPFLGVAGRIVPFSPPRFVSREAVRAAPPGGASMPPCFQSGSSVQR